MAGRQRSPIVDRRESRASCRASRGGRDGVVGTGQFVPPVPAAGVRCRRWEPRRRSHCKTQTSGGRPRPRAGLRRPFRRGWSVSGNQPAPGIICSPSLSDAPAAQLPRHDALDLRDRRSFDGHPRWRYSKAFAGRLRETHRRIERVPRSEVRASGRSPRGRGGVVGDDLGVGVLDPLVPNV